MTRFLLQRKKVFNKIKIKNNFSIEQEKDKTKMTKADKIKNEIQQLENQKSFLLLQLVKEEEGIIESINFCDYCTQQDNCNRRGCDGENFTGVKAKKI